MYYEMFPPVVMAMQEEIQHHPALLQNLLQLPKDAPMEMKLGEVAAFVGIILDGYYDNDQVLELCEEITHKLKHARAELIADFAPPKLIS
jgi:mannose/fructose/N-acetylgalactosamine-specific phosphotransferase system component IIB